jgi:hypothetical protein
MYSMADVDSLKMCNRRFKYSETTFKCKIRIFFTSLRRCDTITRCCLVFVFVTTLHSVFIFHSAEAQVTVDVWTNKGGRGVSNLDGGTYIIGEYIRICFSLNANVDRLRFHIITPDGRDVVYYDRSIAAGTYCIEGWEKGPPGVHRIIVEAWIGGVLVAYDEVNYEVIGCPAHRLYLGLELLIIPISNGSNGELDVLVTIEGWIRPLGIDWNTFKSQCYYGYPGSDYYHVTYIRDKLVRPSLEARSLREIRRGLDDSSQRVWTRFEARFSDLLLSDNEFKILRIKDPIKPRGFIDEVTVKSFRKIWKALPRPTNLYEDTASWRNTENTAPDIYEIYLYPITTIYVRVENLPPGRRVDVLIDGRKVGTLSDVSASLEKRLIGLEHEVDLSPRVITEESQDIRYACINCPLHVKADEATGLANVLLSFVKEYKVKLDTMPRLIGLIVDGNLIPAAKLPFEEWWREGSEHSISLEQDFFITRETNTERETYRFEKWNDGVLDRSRLIKINEPRMITAIFYRSMQYKVEVATDYGVASVICDGIKDVSVWCNEGNFVYAEISSSQIDLGGGVRLVFSHWVANGVSASWPLKVTSPIFVKAVWRVQFFINVDGVVVDASGGGWYYEGEEAYISVSREIVYEGEAKRYVFKEWVGDCNFVNNCRMRELIVKVSQPLNFKAVWYTQYLLRLEDNIPEIDPKIDSNCHEWVNDGEVCKFDVPVEIDYTGNVKYRFTGWQLSSSSSMDKPLVIEIRPLEITINKATVITVNYDPWYFIFIDGGLVKPIVHGCESTSNGAWCRNGSEITIEVPKSTGFLIVNEFDKWSLNGESFTTMHVIRMRVDRPISLTAIWRTNYTGLIVLVVSVGSFVFAVGFVNIKGQTVYKRILLMKDREIKRKLAELERLRREGKISEEAYKEIKKEIERKN